MLKIISSLLFFVYALFSFSNANALDYQTVSALLNKHQNLECDYVQTKTIQGNELESTGHLTLKNKNHIIYAQNEPFEMSLEITENKITQTLDGEVEVIDRQSNAQVFEVSNLLLKVFCADGNLKEYFDYKLEGNTNNWSATLKPKHELLARIFKDITLIGSDKLDKIVIDDCQNDTTKIDFSNYTYQD